MKTLGLILWLFGSAMYAQNSSFDQANALYNDGDYNAAISTYEQILNNKLHSSELYFNLANCYYKLNKVGPSIYYYEKALLLSLGDHEIQNNLNFARKMTIDNINDVPKLGFVKFTNAMLSWFKADQWAVVCICFMFLFVLFFIAYYLTKKTSLKRLFFILESIVLFVMLASFGLMTKKIALEKTLNHAIVFSQEVSLKTEPNLRSETIYLLHEGTKVQLLDSFDDSWTKILLNDGKVGWLPNSAFKPL